MWTVYWCDVIFLFSWFGLQRFWVQRTCMITLTNITLSWTHASMTYWAGMNLIQDGESWLKRVFRVFFIFYFLSTSIVLKFLVIKLKCLCVRVCVCVCVYSHINTILTSHSFTQTLPEKMGTVCAQWESAPGQYRGSGFSGQAATLWPPGPTDCPRGHGPPLLLWVPRV